MIFNTGFATASHRRSQGEQPARPEITDDAKAVLKEREGETESAETMLSPQTEGGQIAGTVRKIPPKNGSVATSKNTTKKRFTNMNTNIIETVT